MDKSVRVARQNVACEAKRLLFLTRNLARVEFVVTEKIDRHEVAGGITTSGTLAFDVVNVRRVAEGRGMVAELAPRPKRGRDCSLVLHPHWLFDPPFARSHSHPPNP